MTGTKKQPTTKDPLFLRERVYNQLRNMIITGKINAGQRLVETTVAARMGVSRTPVREALHKLGLENLVQPIPRVGYIVNDMSEYDVEDLFTTRGAIEQLAARSALEKITDEELQKLERNLARTDQCLGAGQTAKMVELDMEFHEIICRASRSKRLHQIAQMLREHMMKFRKTCLHINEIAEAAGADHREILEAFQAKDAARLDRAMAAHVEHTKKDILNYMRRLKEQLL